jgi:predicted MFS family arabinose efflux permease
MSATFTRYQRFVVGILAFLQFTIVLDFMILSPLGALLLNELKISTGQFGLVVSAYAFSAGAAGFLTAGFADRFDRKRLLLFFYVGFVIGTFCCGVAPTYGTLLAARIVTGLFGGVIGSISMAISADLFPLEMRGRVMGIVQTSFAASQVLGIPLGLLLSNHWGWHAPFLLITALGLVVGVVIAVYLRPVDGHLALQTKGNAFAHLLQTLTTPDYMRGFAATVFLATGGFMLMPFGSAFAVHNLGVELQSLPTLYVWTGVFAIVAGPILGKLGDNIGKYRLLAAGTVVGIGVVLVYCSLGVTPFWMVTLLNVILFISITARIIAASALNSAVPEAKDRGAYMSISSSIQQVAGGVASTIAGLIVVQAGDGRIEHYDTLGYVVVVAMLLTLGLMYSIHKLVTGRQQVAALAAAEASST